MLHVRSRECKKVQVRKKRGLAAAAAEVTFSSHRLRGFISPIVVTGWRETHRILRRKDVIDGRDHGIGLHGIENEN
jgi:hypothetical protein